MHLCSFARSFNMFMSKITATSLLENRKNISMSFERIRYVALMEIKIILCKITLNTVYKIHDDVSYFKCFFF